MPRNDRPRSQTVYDLLIAKAAQHASLSPADEAALRSVPFQLRKTLPGEDIVRQGERPEVAVFVQNGMLARYHLLPNGDRQYLSFHYRTDMPDLQSLFLKMMDFSLCSIDHAEVVLLQHERLREVFLDHSGVAIAFWRMTLVDAAIFRQAITNNSARNPATRLAHFCCEQFVRMREVGKTEGASCKLPLSQVQLSQALGISHISVNRALQRLRKDGLIELRGGKLAIFNWPALVRVAEFDSTYLYGAKKSVVRKLPKQE